MAALPRDLVRPTSASCSTAAASTGRSRRASTRSTSSSSSPTRSPERNQGTDTDGLDRDVGRHRRGRQAPGSPRRHARRRRSAAPTRARCRSIASSTWPARVAEHGADEIALADTIGVAVPTDVARRFDAVRSAIGDGIALRCHFHNTRNTGLANAVAAVESGVRSSTRRSAASAAARSRRTPPATSRPRTSSTCCERMGHHTGVDLDALVAIVPGSRARSTTDPGPAREGRRVPVGGLTPPSWRDGLRPARRPYDPAMRGSERGVAPRSGTAKGASARLPAAGRPLRARGSSTASCRPVRACPARVIWATSSASVGRRCARRSGCSRRSSSS